MRSWERLFPKLGTVQVVAVGGTDMAMGRPQPFHVKPPVVDRFLNPIDSLVNIILDILGCLQEVPRISTYAHEQWASALLLDYVCWETTCYDGDYHNP